jgi:hypothetical protein
MVRVRLKPEDVAYVDALGDKNRTDGLELCIDTTRTLEMQMNNKPHRSSGASKGENDGH